MNFKEILALMSLLVVFSIGNAYNGMEYDLNNPFTWGPENYCSRRLPSVLSKICPDPSARKRTVGTNTHNELELPWSLKQNEVIEWPWIPRHKARNAALPGRGKREQVVSECCNRACTIGELMTYCQRDD